MYIEKYLTKETIQVGCEARNWKHAIEIASEPLLRNHRIEAEYVSAMQAAVEEFGPYMVLAEGFALAHAKPGPMVHEVCMSLSTIHPPVNFGNKDFAPVDILIAFGTPDSKSHIEVLRELCTLLNNPGTFKMIRKANSAEEIISLFSTQCKE